MERPTAGTIVLVDWRGDRQPDEPGGVRPAVVVENADLFAGGGYRNIIVVPLSRSQRFAVMGGLVESIEPTDENGAEQLSWAIAHHVASVALTRVRATRSRVSAAQLESIRAKAALAIGVPTLAG